MRCVIEAPQPQHRRKKATCSEVDARSRLDDHGCTKRESNDSSSPWSFRRLTHLLCYHLKLPLEYQDTFPLLFGWVESVNAVSSENVHCSARRANEENQTTRS